MDRRFILRKEQMLKQCEVSPDHVRRLPAELSVFLKPFLDGLSNDRQRQHVQRFCKGLLSNVTRKNTEAIAYEQDQDRHDLQHFIGSSTWNHVPLMDELCGQIAATLGEADGVLVIDPSAFPKQGRKSVGAAQH